MTTSAPAAPLAFRYHPIASSLHVAEELAAYLAPYEEALRAAGGSPIPPPAPAPDPTSAAPLVAFIQTGGTEQAARALLAQTDAHVPFLLLAHPAHNSLPAALEILARCRQLRRHANLFYLRSPDDPAPLAAFADAFRAATAAARLRSARIGRFGASSDWLIASSHDPSTVAARFGCTLLPISIDDLRAAIRDTPLPVIPPPGDPAAADHPDAALYARATTAQDVSPATFAASLRFARALRTLAEDLRLDALTVRCFDLLSGGFTGCLALALLADEGIPAACEGDIPSTLALLWTRLLTGRPAWMANPADIDPATDTALLAHCTTPLSLACSYAFKTHFESGIGLAIDATLPPGPATLLRLGGDDLSLAQAADVTLLESLHRPGLCRTQARIALPPGAAARWLSAPLGNHVILAPGHHFAATFLRSFAYTLPPPPP